MAKEKLIEEVAYCHDQMENEYLRNDYTRGASWSDEIKRIVANALRLNIVTQSEADSLCHFGFIF